MGEGCMELSSCRKIYRNETQRAVDPAVTLERIERLLPTTGITRVADITGLDRVGIPVFSCIRPAAADGAISVYNGKGATPIAARVSAIMEGIERYSAEVHDRPLIMGTHSSLAEQGSVVDPRDLILPRDADPDQVLPWVKGYNIIQHEEVLLPAHAVFHPLPQGTARLFRTSTNGIASGNTLEEATFHALAEIVERDAWSIAEVLHDTGPVITDVTDPTACSLLEAFSKAGVEIVLHDLTSDIGIPTIAAASDDPVLRDPGLLTLGMGTHTSTPIATLRALTEVAQSRVTQIHGAREDTTEANKRRSIGYDRVKRLNRYWYEEKSTVPYSALASCDTDDFLDDIRVVTDRLAAVGLDRVIISDLTRPETGVNVVRVVVPGLETYAMDSERRGERCRHAGHHRLSRT